MSQSRSRLPHRASGAVLASALLAGTVAAAEPSQPTDPQRYVGMWVTDDGYIRHELLPDGRYDEARGRTRSAYQGRYVISGDHIDYVDDTGFTADGEFVNDVLYHGGMVLRRERPATASPPPRN